MALDGLIQTGQDLIPGTAQIFKQSRVDDSRINESLGPNRKFQVNAALEKRAGLRFVYPQHTEPNKPATTDGVSKPKAAETIRWLPFCENPSIVESRKANYANQKILLRNEPARLYVGSEPRKFKVDFHYSLIHLASMIPSDLILRIFSEGDEHFDEQAMALRAYLQEIMERDTGQRSYLNAVDGDLKNVIREMANRLVDGSEGFFGPVPNDEESQFNNMLLHIMRSSKEWYRVSRLFQYAINHIRNSVISTVATPIQAPPIVELKWGALYDFTPCIVTNYQFNIEERAGYDVKSLYPQRLRITLSMEEMRGLHGDGERVRDQLPGWDTVLAGGFPPPQSFRTTANSPRFRTHDGAIPLNLTVSGQEIPSTGSLTVAGQRPLPNRTLN
jgi:hypothetical protein